MRLCIFNFIILTWPFIVEMTDNLNNVPDVAGSNPVIVEPSPWVHTLTMGSTSTQSLTVSVPVNHNEKPEKFIDLNFKTWQQKMLLYLTTLNLARFLKEILLLLERMKLMFKVSMLWKLGSIQISCVEIIF